MPETARIILVDDEPALLKLMKSYLERLGHQVEAYPNGVDALAGFAATPTTFSLLVADLTLPDMSGLDMQ
ncbi:MAG: response regulator [Bryobacteraceae bacterium]